jgi:general stress protein YciG
MRFDGERAREIGLKGGHVTRETLGPDFMATIGRKGGESTKAKGMDYKQLAKLGREAQKNMARWRVLKEVAEQADALGRDLPSLLEWIKDEMAKARPKKKSGKGPGG